MVKLAERYGIFHTKVQHAQILMVRSLLFKIHAVNLIAKKESRVSNTRSGYWDFLQIWYHLIRKPISTMVKKYGVPPPRGIGLNL